MPERYCQNTDQNPTESIWYDSRSHKLPIQPEQTSTNLKESVGENHNIFLIQIWLFHILSGDIRFTDRTKTEHVCKNVVEGS